MRVPKPEGNNGGAETSTSYTPRGLIPGITSWDSSQFMCDSPRNLFLSSSKNSQQAKADYEVLTKDLDVDFDVEPENEAAAPVEEKREEAEANENDEVREEPPQEEMTNEEERPSEEEEEPLKEAAAPAEATAEEPIVKMAAENPTAEVVDEGVIAEPTTPIVEPVTPKDRFECDYDISCTETFMELQRKEWTKACMRVLDFPTEARTWVARREKAGGGKLRWRLLPIHAAIIFKAPDSVVESLLAAYPKGAQCKDDQGMLPLHLAFRHGSSHGTVNLLLVAFPESVNVQDRKGRIPLVLAQASASPNRDAFVRALERGPTYYASAAAATERAAVTAEQRAIFDAKLIDVEKKHQQDIKNLKDERDGLNDTVDLLQSELAKQKGTTQVLVDHVTSLEAQLKDKTETERFLAVKALSLDADLKEVTAKKEQVEAEMAARIDELQNVNDSLMTSGNSDYFAGSGQPMNTDLKKLREKITLQEKELKSLKMDWASAQAKAAVLEAQLKSKIENEHELTSQISSLSGKIASLTTGPSGEHRVKELEKEREKLRLTVNELSKKLIKVTQLMSKIQDSKAAAEDEAKLIADASHQEELIRKAMEERKQMAAMLKRQEEEMEKTAREHQAILQKLSAMKAHAADPSQHHLPLTHSTEEEVKGVLGHVLDGVNGDSDLVDTVCKNMKVESKEHSEDEEAEDRGPPLDARLDTFSSEFEEDPQKCLETALKALELSRAKTTKAMAAQKAKCEEACDSASDISLSPTDEGEPGDICVE